MIYSEPWQDIEDSLFALIGAEARAGGRLDGIKSVQNVSPPTGRNEDTPAIGVQFQHADEESGGMGQRHQLVYLEIMIVYVQQFDPTSPDIARAAKAAVAKFANDRAGNGVLPLLRDDPTLGGLVNFMAPVTQSLEVGQSDDKTTLSSVYRIVIQADAQFRYH